MTEPMDNKAELYEESERKANSSKRLMWVLIVAAVAIVACGAVTVAVGVGGLLIRRGGTVDTGVTTWEDQGERVIERTFQVGDEAEIEIDSIAGSIKVVGSDTDEIQVTATKRTRLGSDPDKVTVVMSQDGDKVKIETKRRSNLNVPSVQIVAIVPQHTLVDARSSAGSVTVENLSSDVRAFSSAGAIRLGMIEGDVSAKTSAGSIRADGMRGPVRLESSAGSVTYEGEPWGDCLFDSSAGSVTLRLPADLDARLDARASAGSVTIDYDLTGTVERNHVRGVIGDGSQADITAKSSAGSVTISRR